MRRKADKPTEDKSEQDKLYFVVACVADKRRFEIHKASELQDIGKTDLVAIGDELRGNTGNTFVELYQNKKLVMRLEFARAVTSDEVLAIRYKMLQEGKAFFAPEVKGTIWEYPYIYGCVNLQAKPQDSPGSPISDSEAKIAIKV